MPAYLGPVGGLIPLRGMNASEITNIRASSDKVTLGGRLKTQRAAHSRREWAVSTHDLMNPGDVASVLALELGGVPPWVWVEPLAQVTNLLSPEQSVLMPGTFSGAGVVAGGAVSVGGAMSPRSVLHASGGTVDFGYRDGVPDRPVVVPGVPVTVSAYVRGTGLLGVSWRDWSGGVVSETTQAYSNAVLARSSLINLVPPVNAATVHIWATGVLQAAMPALTWTADLAAWSVGRGCNRVVMGGLSETVRMAAVNEPSSRRSGISFTVREVG